jgi:hypothetical protein
MADGARSRQRIAAPPRMGFGAAAIAQPSVPVPSAGVPVTGGTS